MSLIGTIPPLWCLLLVSLTQFAGPRDSLGSCRNCGSSGEGDGVLSRYGSVSHY